MKIQSPYLLFLGDAPDALSVKVARGIAHWRPEKCLGQLRLPGCRADLGLRDLTVAEAAEAGARTLVVGVANRGGRLGESWVPTLLEALSLDMDLAAGMHGRLGDVPEIAETAHNLGRALFDVRLPDKSFEVGTGAPRSGRRLLTVGTDCSVGKMFTSLAIEREMQARKLDVTFRATGQTGIMVEGSGVAVDAVVADFISGAVEDLAPAAGPEHWDLIEGQGSLFHPSYAGVSLGLLHGAQAEALVMCTEAHRPHMRGLPDRPMPDLSTCIEANEAAARLTCPAARMIGVSVNTSMLDEAEAREHLDSSARETGLPCTDAVRFGAGVLVDALP